MAALDEIAAFMERHGLLLVTAESCTAGLIAAKLAGLAGAAKVLDSAFVAYSPEAKERSLGVRRETIERAGLTSEDVAREMALGALGISRATLAIANTGVADDSACVPAGTQCLAWAFRPAGGDVMLFSETRRFDGDRNAVREACADYALQRVPDHFRQLGTTH